MSTKRIVFFSSSLTLFLFVVACGGGGKKSGTGITPKNNGNPAKMSAACQAATDKVTSAKKAAATKKSAAATAAETQAEQDAKTACATNAATGGTTPANSALATDGSIDETKLTANPIPSDATPAASAGCADPLEAQFADQNITLDDGYGEIQIAGLADAQDGSWQLTTDDSWTEIENTDTKTKNQMQASMDPGKATLVAGQLNQSIGKIICNSIQITPSPAADATTSDDATATPPATAAKNTFDNIVQLRLDHPNLINRQSTQGQKAIATSRYDVWLTGNSKEKIGSQVYAAPVVLDDTKSFGTVTGVVNRKWGIKADKSSVELLETFTEPLDSSHTQTIHARSIYTPVATPAAAAAPAAAPASPAAATSDALSN